MPDRLKSISSAARDEGIQDEPGEPSQRLDRWLWFARVTKTRTLAAAVIEAGKIRVNAVKAVKPSHTLKPGDVVTSAVTKDVRILKVRAAGMRRGSAIEAQTLYEDLTPPPAVDANAGADRRKTLLSGQREPGSGRPTKRDRRLMVRMFGGGD